MNSNSLFMLFSAISTLFLMFIIPFFHHHFIIPMRQSFYLPLLFSLDASRWHQVLNVFLFITFETFV